MTVLIDSIVLILISLEINSLAFIQSVWT